jgi:multiple sugar transport system substrate-binding protein
MTRLLVLAFLVVVSLVAGSCEPNSGSSSSGTPTVLVFKHGKVAAKPRALAPLLQEFEQSHPGVQVREEILPSSSDQQHQFYAINLEGRSVGFDLLAMDVIWVQEFAKAGWILDLDQLLPSPAHSAFFPSTIQAATFEGRLYAVPCYVDAGVLFYRRDLLEQYGFPPPRTWPELVKVTRTILEGMRDPALKGFIWQGKQYEGLICTALEFIWSHGGDIPTGRDADTEAALAFMGNLIRDGISPPLVSTADEEKTRHLFGSGRAIFMRNWPYAYELFQQKDSPVRGKVGLAPLPSAPGYQARSVLGGWMLAIPHRSGHQQEAAELIRFLTSPQSQRRIALEIGYRPSRTALYEDEALLREQPWLADLAPVLRDARPRPLTPYYPMLSQVWQPELSAVLVGIKTPRAALASGRQQMARIVAIEEPAFGTKLR